MIARRILIPLVALIVMVLGVWGVSRLHYSESWATRQAASRLADVRRDTDLVTGPHYETTIAVTNVTRTDYYVILPQWNAEYSATMRSLECTAFEAKTSDSLPLGPWMGEGLAGGLHDWPVLRDLDGWERTHRVALLYYVASEGNPWLESVTPLATTESLESGNGERSFGPQDLSRAGGDAGLKAPHLAQIEFYENGDIRRRRLSFDEKMGAWARIE